MSNTTNRFRALHAIAAALKVLAFLPLILMPIVALIQGAVIGGGGFAYAGAFGGLLGGGILWLVITAIAQSIFLFLAMEEHLRNLVEQKTPPST